MATPLILAPLDGDLAYEDGVSGGTATGTGALRWTSGHTPGVQAAFVEEGTTNQTANSSMESALYGWTGAGTIDSTVGLFGSSSVRGTGAGTVVIGQNNTSPYAMPPVSSGQTWTASAWIRGSSGGEPVKFQSIATTNVGYNVAQTEEQTFICTTDWQRVSVPMAITAGTAARLRIRIEVQPQGGTVWLDGFQQEQLDHATSYADGSLGAGYAFLDVVHQSPSTREASSLSIPMSAPGSVALRYSEDGTTWDFAYLETLGALGTYGNLAYSGGNLVISSSRALYIGPVFAFADTLTAPEQTTLETEAEWTFGMLSGPVAVTTIRPQIIGLGSVAS